MNHTIDQILYAHLLDEDHMHWPDYVDVTEMVVNPIINASITKAPFKTFMVKTLDYLLAYYCLKNPPLAPMLTHLLTK